MELQISDSFAFQTRVTGMVLVPIVTTGDYLKYVAMIEIQLYKFYLVTNPLQTNIRSAQSR